MKTQLILFVLCLSIYVSGQALLPIPYSVSCSQSEQQTPCNNLLFGQFWSSGGFGPQWVEFDLGSPHKIYDIAMNVSMYPNVYTSNVVSGFLFMCADSHVTAGLYPYPDVEVAWYNGSTVDKQVINLQLNVIAQHLRVTTFIDGSYVGYNTISLNGIPLPSKQ